jgi:hypothetical protein
MRLALGAWQAGTPRLSTLILGMNRGTGQPKIFEPEATSRVGFALLNAKGRPVPKCG